MGADDFATLGLEPGADRDTIERAYRRLIKHHHPDREGGDTARAADITRAYRELREQRMGGIEFHDQVAVAPARFSGVWMMVALILAGASLALIYSVAQGSFLVERKMGGTARVLVPSAAGRTAEPMKQPIDDATVAAAITDARRIASNGDEMVLTNASRACHDRLRNAPSVALLDRCAAFDNAVVVLQDRDPMRNRGAFSELAVTGRQWSAAKGLSGDYMSIDARLDEIRLRVELALAPSAAPPL